MTVKKRPPTDAKLRALVATLREPDSAEYFAASSAVRAIYAKGLPSGLDPEVVSDAVALSPPTGYDLGRMLKKVGEEYDAAIIEGSRRRIESGDAQWVLELSLVATLSAHSDSSISKAWATLLTAERAVDRSAETNAPDAPSREMVLAVRTHMAPWMTERVLDATLALGEALPPSLGGSGASTWVTSVQCDEEWTLLIACACHPSPRARALIASRKALGDRFEEPLRTIFLQVLTLCDALEPA